MRTAVLKYIALCFVLLLMLERNSLPLASLFAKQTEAAAKDLCDDSTEEPAKTSENVKELSARDYLHEFASFRFSMPVFLLPVKTVFVHQTKAPYTYAPDVLTPPPNRC